MVTWRQGLVVAVLVAAASGQDSRVDSVRIEGVLWHIRARPVGDGQVRVEMRESTTDEPGLGTTLSADAISAVAYAGEGAILAAGRRSGEGLLFVLRSGPDTLHVEASARLPAEFVRLATAPGGTDVFGVADGSVYGAMAIPGALGVALGEWSVVPGIPPHAPSFRRLGWNGDVVALFADGPTNQPIREFVRCAEGYRSTIPVPERKVHRRLELRGDATCGGQVEIFARRQGPVVLRSAGLEAPVATIAASEVDTWARIALPGSMVSGRRHSLVASDGASVAFFPHEVVGAGATRGNWAIAQDLRANADGVRVGNPVMFAWLRVLRQELVEETIETFVLVQRGSGDVAPRTRSVGEQVFLEPDRLLRHQQLVGAEQRSVAVSVPVRNDMERADDRSCVQFVVRARNGWVVSRIVGVRQLLADETPVAEPQLVASARAAWAAEAQPAEPVFARLVEDWGHSR